MTERKRKLMNLLDEDLARAQMSVRLGEAHEQRRRARFVRAVQLSRRAERAALKARVALARAL